MSDFTLKEYTQEEYNADLKHLLSEKGLHDAVEGICDRINSIASILGYLQHREIQELLCEIIDLIDMYMSGIKNDSDVADINAGEIEPTTKNDLGVECINRAELLKAMNTWDKFGNDPNEGLIPLRTPALQDRYVPYVKYDDMVKCIKAMPSVTPQEPRKGHWISHREFCEKNNLRPSGLGSYFWCSECDCGIDSKNFARMNYNYCPNCGRKME